MTPAQPAQGRTPEAGAHTPTPWALNGGIFYGSATHKQFITAGDGSDHVITLQMNPASEHEEANAAFIIQACNSHDALVTANTEMARILQHLLDTGTYLGSEVRTALAEAQRGS